MSFKNHFKWKMQLFARLLTERAWKWLVRHAPTILQASWQTDRRTQSSGFTWFNMLHESPTRHMVLPCSVVKTNLALAHDRARAKDNNQGYALMP